METHVFEAIENNILGTYTLAVAAAEHGVEEFVMLSTDKAVRPASVMGATKRVAELILQFLQNGGTQYIMVRFSVATFWVQGRVSSPSSKANRRGDPVKVTHPDMRRYFMTIPEACQLVLQASAIGEGGQICVLDMGQPVKIADSGHQPYSAVGTSARGRHQDRIHRDSARKKLYEEVSSYLEDTVPSEHEKVRIFTGREMPETDLVGWIRFLAKGFADLRDIGKLLIALKQVVVDYNWPAWSSSKGLSIPGGALKPGWSSRSVMTELRWQRK